MRRGAPQGWLGLLAVAFVGVGYSLGDIRAVVALLGAAAIACWGVFAFHRPAAALGASFPLLLLAGTKFRTRDPDASLAGAVDAQILLELGLFAMIAVGVAAVRFSGRACAVRLPLVSLLGAYVGLCLASTVWSAAPALTMVRATQLAIVAALATTAIQVLSPERSLRLLALSTAAFAAVCGAIAALFPWARAASEDGRFAWFSVHPIEAATLAAIGALGCLGLGTFRTAPEERRLAPVLPYALWAGVLIGLLVVTGSRGPMLGLAAGLAALVLMRLHLPARVPIVLAALSVLLAALAVGPELRPWLDELEDDHSAVSRLILRGESADTVLELNGRLELWEDVKPAIDDRPVAGYGYQASRPVMLDAAPWAAYAHNALLQTLLDLGLLGTLLLAVILVAALAAAGAGAIDPHVRGAIAALTAFLVVNSISTESFAGAPGVDALLLFTCSLCAASRRLAATPEQPATTWVDTRAAA